MEVLSCKPPVCASRGRAGDLFFRLASDRSFQSEVAMELSERGGWMDLLLASHSDRGAEGFGNFPQAGRG